MFAYRDFLNYPLSGRSKSQNTSTFPYMDSFQHEDSVRLYGRTLNIRITKPTPKLPGIEVKHPTKQHRTRKKQVKLPSSSSPPIPITRLLIAQEKQDIRAHAAGSHLNQSYRSNDCAVMSLLRSAHQYIPIFKKQRHPRDTSMPNAISPRLINTSFMATEGKRRRKRLNIRRTGEELSIHGLKTDVGKLSSIALVNDMTGEGVPEHLGKFLSTIEKHYAPGYLLLDPENKGKFTKEDILRVVNTRSLPQPERTAKLIYRTFSLVSEVLDRKSYSAVACAFEYVNPGKHADFDLLNRELLRTLFTQITELKGVYSSYNITGDLTKEDIGKYCRFSHLSPTVSSLLRLIPGHHIPFNVFLKHLPFFLWLTRQLLRRQS